MEEAARKRKERLEAFRKRKAETEASEASGEQRSEDDMRNGNKSRDTEYVNPMS